MMAKKLKSKKRKPIAKLFFDKDITNTLKKKTIAVLGYASQGRAQALCLKESNVHVILGLRKKGTSWKNAIKDGWKKNENLFKIEDAVKKADIISFLIADTAQKKVYERNVKPYLRKGQTLLFAHGFNIHYNFIKYPPNTDVILVAPEGPGDMLREKYSKKSGVIALVAVENNFSGNAWNTALAYAKAIGCARAGVLKTTFREETETNLFAEQTVLCGGITKLVDDAQELMLKEGYNPLMVYWITSHTLYGLIAPIAFRFGNAGMLSRVSRTAQKGAFNARKKMFKHNKTEMKKILEEIKSGKFAKEWMREYETKGVSVLNAKLKKLNKSSAEKAGKFSRKIMKNEN
jgi:ketol-acid reductoisomerase